jgi:diguanylate cyclase (GGDEF)-like protein/PAS domain S-box-containing protein
VSALVGSLDVGLLVIGLRGLVHWANPAALHLLYGPDADLPSGSAIAEHGIVVVDLVHPDDLVSAVLTAATSVREKSPYRLEFRIVRPDGTVRWVRSYATPQFDEDGQWISSVSAWVDITDEVDAKLSSRRFAEVTDVLTDVVAIVAPDGHLAYLNQAGQRHLPIPVDGEPRPSFERLFAENCRARVLEDALPRAVSEGHWEGELVLHPAGGRLVPVSLSLVSHRTPDGELEYLSLIARDISELKAAERSLREQASRDVLTGLANRPVLFDRLESALARASRSGRVCAVLFVDLDGFKSVNDHLGHQAGDELLVQVARRIDGAVRRGDLTARLGGDEFVVVCEQLVDPGEAILVAERIVRAVGAPYPELGRPETFTASVGVAFGDGRVRGIDLLRHADLAVYEAKKRGRGRVVPFEPSMDPAA